MEIQDVVRKILGPIEPIGETNADNERYENLKVTIDLINTLLFDISQVAQYSTCPEFSRSRAGKRAKQFLIEIKELCSPIK